jgi:hypothetical protein
MICKADETLTIACQGESSVLTQHSHDTSIHSTFFRHKALEDFIVTQSFSKLMTASEGRYLTSIEEESAVASSIELKHRMMVSRLIQQNEYSIVDYATQAFCDIMPGFDAPKGSVRRKKGHQDGRIMLRYIAQSIREGSSEIFFEKVLSWLIGHLDERNVTGQNMEIFCHFIHQGVRRELPVTSAWICRACFRRGHCLHSPSVA